MRGRNLLRPHTLQHKFLTTRSPNALPIESSVSCSSYDGPICGADHTVASRLWLESSASKSKKCGNLYV